MTQFLLNLPDRLFPTTFWTLGLSMNYERRVYAMMNVVLKKTRTTPTEQRKNILFYYQISI